MDIFGSEYETLASSITVKVLKDFDDPLPGIVAAAVISNESITDNITDYLNNGWYSRSEKYYRYGRDHFARGLPDSAVTDYSPDYKEIRRIIETEVNSKILFNYVVLSTTSAPTYVAKYLQDVRQIDTKTYEISVYPPGITPVPSIMVYTGMDIAEDNLSVTLHYSYDLILTFSETIPLPYQTELVYQVQYQLLDVNLETTGNPVYWLYVKGAGTYPTLDAPKTVPEDGDARYYPVVPFYENKIQIGDPANEGTPLYDTSKNLLKKFGFKYSEVVDSLAEGTEESIGKNKGIYAYMYLGAEVTAGILPNQNTASAEEKRINWEKNQATINYLIDYFSNLIPKSLVTKKTFNNFIVNSQKFMYPPFNATLISDGSFNIGLNYLYITRERKTGVIGHVGWCNNEYVYATVSGPLTGITAPSSYLLDSSLLIYRKQESATTYTELTVCGLAQVSYIFDNTSAKTFPKDAFRSEDPAIITVPLDRNIVREKSNHYRNRLIHSSLCFVFNAYQIVEIKWYATSLWQTIFTMAAIILAIPSGGTSFSWASLLTAAGLKAAAYALLIRFLKYLIYKELIKEVAKHYGVDIAYILAISMMAYGKFGNFNGLPKMPFAENFISIGNSMWSATKSVIQENMKELEKDKSTTDYQMKQAQKELDKAKKLLDTEADLNPWLFINPLPDLMFSHDATTFINLRVHNSNPGVATLLAPSNYVDLMLTLPTIDDTLTK